MTCRFLTTIISVLYPFTQKLPYFTIWYDVRTLITQSKSPTTWSTGYQRNKSCSKRKVIYEESKLVHDADQLDLIVELKEQNDLGNTYAAKWIHFARQRLITQLAKEIAEEILTTDSTDWWFKGHDDWWRKSRKE